ncbi:MAG: hypothetical protein KDB01_27180, partial [Planctomycetaceae bacterium]|nr:hypothetical protein [Planctomycetaceae bacterium]
MPGSLMPQNRNLCATRYSATPDSVTFPGARVAYDFNWAMEIGLFIRSPVVALQLQREWTPGPRTRVRGYRLSLLRNWAVTVETHPPHGANVIAHGQQSQRDDRG